MLHWKPLSEVFGLIATSPVQTECFTIYKCRAVGASRLGLGPRARHLGEPVSGQAGSVSQMLDKVYK